MRLPMEMTAGQIAQLIGGRVHGAADTKVSTVATSPLQAKETDIAFLHDAKLLKKLEHCKAAVVIVPEGVKADRTLIIVKRPNLAIQRILTALQPKRYLPAPGIHPSAVVDETAEIGADAAIGALVYIGPKSKIGARTKICPGTSIGGEVTIGEDCLIHQNSCIADYVKIGNRVTLQQGACIGSDGFGYVSERPSNMELRMSGINELSDEPNPLLKIPQTGTVVVHDDVEIGSYATIDRATIGATVIGQGSKIDNQVMIAHNCSIGREVIVVAHSGVAGSCSVGDRAVIAGHVGIKDHVQIGKDAIIEGMAGVMRDIPDREVQVGVPAVPAREHFQQLAHIRKLPKIQDDLKQMQKRIAQLEQQLRECCPEPELVKG